VPEERNEKRLLLISQQVNLTVNGVGDEGAARLAQVLQLNSTLTSLYVGGS